MSIPTWASVVVALSAATLLAVIGDFVYSKITKVPFKPQGKYCLITGGSTGLGKALAIELVKSGAHVCIVARRITELESAVNEIETYKKRQDQQVIYISADVTSQKDVVRVFEEVNVKMGQDPDFVCACAGASYPKFFLDHTMEDFEKLTTLNYLGQAYIAHVKFKECHDDRWMILTLVFFSLASCSAHARFQY